MLKSTVDAYFFLVRVGQWLQLAMGAGKSFYGMGGRRGVLGHFWRWLKSLLFTVSWEVYFFSIRLSTAQTTWSVFGRQVDATGLRLLATRHSRRKT